jgi:hypothetical protein
MQNENYIILNNSACVFSAVVAPRGKTISIILLPCSFSPKEVYAWKTLDMPFPTIYYLEIPNS